MILVKTTHLVVCTFLLLGNVTPFYILCLGFFSLKLFGQLKNWSIKKEELASILPALPDIDSFLGFARHWRVGASYSLAKHKKQKTDPAGPNLLLGPHLKVGKRTRNLC